MGVCWCKLVILVELDEWVTVPSHVSNVGFFCVSCACANGSLYFCRVDARSLLYSVRYVRGGVRGVGSGGCARYKIPGKTQQSP